MLVCVPGAAHPFLCSASALRPQDGGILPLHAPTVPNQPNVSEIQADGIPEKCCISVDPAIELPLAEIPTSQFLPRDWSRNDLNGEAWAAPLETSREACKSLSLRCLEEGLDPSPALRVEIAKALTRHILCTGEPALCHSHSHAHTP